MHPSRTPVVLALLLTVASCCGLAGAARADDDDVLVRDENATYPLQSARTLKLDVPVGEVRVTTAPGEQVQARFRLRCERRSYRCRDHAAALHLSTSRGADSLTVKVDGYDRDGKKGINHPDVELDIVLPASLELQVDLGVGELDVRGIEGDLTVDMGVGEARVQVPRSAVRSVSVDVGVGEASLSPRDEDTHRHGFLFLGNEVDWREGTGRARVSVDVGVGEASVRLLP